MNILQKAYVRGFCKTAEAYGVDPIRLSKFAQAVNNIRPTQPTGPMVQISSSDRNTAAYNEIFRRLVTERNVDPNTARIQAQKLAPQVSKNMSQDSQGNWYYNSGTSDASKGRIIKFTKNLRLETPKLVAQDQLARQRQAQIERENAIKSQNIRYSRQVNQVKDRQSTMAPVKFNTWDGYEVRHGGAGMSVGGVTPGAPQKNWTRDKKTGQVIIQKPGGGTMTQAQSPSEIMSRLASGDSSALNGIDALGFDDDTKQRIYDVAARHLDDYSANMHAQNIVKQRYGNLNLPQAVLNTRARQMTPGIRRNYMQNDNGSLVRRSPAPMNQPPYNAQNQYAQYGRYGARGSYGYQPRGARIIRRNIPPAELNIINNNYRNSAGQPVRMPFNVNRAQINRSYVRRY